jgi:hypothetical protein
VRVVQRSAFNSSDGILSIAGYLYPLFSIAISTSKALGSGTIGSAARISVCLTA